jgi:hypothetical protein
MSDLHCILGCSLIVSIWSCLIMFDHLSAEIVPSLIKGDNNKAKCRPCEDVAKKQKRNKKVKMS